MRKIKLIKEYSHINYENPEYKELTEMYMINTVSKTEAISSLADLISDIDSLISLGVDDYLNLLKYTLSSYDAIVNDTLHARNLAILTEDEKQRLELDERTAYVRRADLKLEIQFIETNKSFTESLIKILSKIINYTKIKNERVYTSKFLTYTQEIINNENK